MQAKATNIFNVNIRYLQHLMANIIFGRNDSQNVCRKAELFLICCAFNGAHADTSTFIIRHLVEVAKTTHENVIGVWGTITMIAQALGHGGKFDSLEPHFLRGSLDIATLARMTIIDTKGGINKYLTTSKSFSPSRRSPVPPSQTNETGIVIV